MENELEKADVALGAKLASNRHNWLVRQCCKVGQIGDQEPLYAIGAAVALLGFMKRDGRLGATGISVMAAVGVADISKRLIKRGVTRSRPHQLLDRGSYEREKGGSDEKAEQSFPSGHVACSVAAARAVSRFYPAAEAASMLAAAGIGVTRLLKGAHWPIDVAAGIAVGLLAEAASHRILGSRCYRTNDDGQHVQS